MTQDDPLIDRLSSALDARASDIRKEQSYYVGELPQLVLPDRLLASYAAIVKQARSPWGELVIDTTAERMTISGFRVLTPDENDTDVEADRLSWDIWQNSQCDTFSASAFVEMLKHGVAYALVEQGDGNDLPLITFEHPSTAITLTAPGGRSTIAGLKRWSDPDGGVDIAVVWVPDGAVTLIRDRRRGSQGWEVSENPLAANTTGQVPMFPLRNKPDLLGGYTSDLASLYTTIDRATQSLADRITTQYYSSTRVRYLIGVEPELKEDGTPTNATLKLATDKLLLIENPDAKAGVFEASDLRQFIEVARSDIAALAALTKLPSYLLSGDMVNVSAEALRSLMEGLVSRVTQRQIWASMGLSQSMRLALKLAGDDRVDDPRCRVEPIWSPVIEPDASTASSAAVGLVGAGILSPTGAQDVVLKYTPSERQKLAEYARADALSAQGAQLIAGLMNPQPTAAPAEPGQVLEPAVA